MRFEGTSEYVATDDLKVAVNAAVLLRRPLLVKGEPGTGKTVLAHQISKALDAPLIEWHVKSTTKAQQGLYEYDAVARLRDGQLGDDRFGRNAFLNHPIRKYSDEDALSVWFGILGTDITLDIERRGNDLQYFGDFFSDFHTVLDRFGRLDDDLFSSELFGKRHTAGAFGSFLGSRLCGHCGSLGKLLLLGPGGTEFKKSELVFARLAVALFTFGSEKLS